MSNDPNDPEIQPEVTERIYSRVGGSGHVKNLATGPVPASLAIEDMALHAAANTTPGSHGRFELSIGLNDLARQYPIAAKIAENNLIKSKSYKPKLRRDSLKILQSTMTP